jgi:LmbE family N-acetylglucosaminyl deacetylase
MGVMLDKLKRILILAPHTDDGELGCGATISKLLRENVEVFYVAFSSCEESLEEGLPSDTLVKELYEATGVLGIPKENVFVKSYKVRHFQESRQQLLDDLILLDRQLNPDIIFMPSSRDIHQDHSTVSSEGLRAFKKKTIFAYELPWNNYSFHNQAFVSVDENDVEKKVSAIQQYKSQHGRQYAKPDYIRSLLKTHGVQIGVPYAEVFEIPRYVIKGR